VPDTPAESDPTTSEPVLTAKDLIPDWVREDGKKTPQTDEERTAKAEVRRRQKVIQALIDRNAQLEDENQDLQKRVNSHKATRAMERQILDAANRLPVQLLLNCAAAARVFGQIQALAEEEGDLTFGLGQNDTLVATVINQLGTFTMTLKGEGNWIQGALQIDAKNRRRIPSVDIDEQGMVPSGEQVMARLLEVDNNLVSARAKQKFQPEVASSTPDIASAAAKAVREARRRLELGPQDISFWTSPFDRNPYGATRPFYTRGWFVHLDGPTVVITGGEVPR
jgi:hypothetical protein